MTYCILHVGLTATLAMWPGLFTIPNLLSPWTTSIPPFVTLVDILPNKKTAVRNNIYV